MIVDRYYYNQLNKKEQEIYKILYKGLQEHKDLIPVQKSDGVSEEMVYRIFCAITDDNPLIYYMNQSVISMAQDAFGNIAICPKYFFTEDKIRQYNKKIQDTVNKLAVQLKLTEGSELEKVQKVHDYMCNTIAYDFDGADKSDPAQVIMSHNIIGVFAHHRAQCEGIAKAVKVLLNAVDVRCLVVSGRATTDEGRTSEHAWNLVNIDGTPTHMDATWDIGASEKGAIAYDYYNVTDAQIMRNHTIDGKVPECSSEKYNYFRMNRLVFKSRLALKAYIEKGIKAGVRMFYFRVDGSLKPQEIIGEMAEFGGQIILDQGQQGRCSQIVNVKMKTCRITFY